MNTLTSTTTELLSYVSLFYYLSINLEVILLLTSVFKIANPPVPSLYEDALVYETGTAITSSGALTAYSGAKTGRSPSDKRIVEEDSSKNDVWWGPVNKPMTTDVSLSVLFLSLACLAVKLFGSGIYAIRYLQHRMSLQACCYTVHACLACMQCMISFRFGKTTTT